MHEGAVATGGSEGRTGSIPSRRAPQCGGSEWGRRKKAHGPPGEPAARTAHAQEQLHVESDEAFSQALI